MSNLISEEPTLSSIKLYDLMQNKNEAVYYSHFTKQNMFSSKEQVRILYSPITKIMTLHYFTFPKIVSTKKLYEERDHYFSKLIEDQKDLTELRFWDKDIKQTEKNTLVIPYKNIFLKRNLKLSQKHKD